MLNDETWRRYQRGGDSVNRQKYLDKVLPFFPKATIYKNDEIIIEPKNNIYFRIDNIRSTAEFDCKMLEYVSRSACKGVSKYWQAYMLRGLNGYFRRTWTKEEMMDIYTYLGNGVNRILCKKFIKIGFDSDVLRKDKP